MTPEQLVEEMKRHNEIGNVSPLVGFWGVADPTDIGNGRRTDDYGPIPLNDPQFQDVMAFIEERCPPSNVRGFFTPIGAGMGQENPNLEMYVVYDTPDGRVYIAEAVDLARTPHVELARIIAFSGQTPNALLDVYPGLDNRTAQKSGSPVDLNRPWPEMGPRCYHPSAADDPAKYVPFEQARMPESERAKARYRAEDQRVFEVTERTVGTSYFGGPPAAKVRVWQVVNW